MSNRWHIPGRAAWDSLVRMKSARWFGTGDPADSETTRARIARGLVLTDHAPKFGFSADDTFFCIGSCFAKNLEEHLIYRDLRVLSKAVPFPSDHGRPNGIVNKYSAASILNELRWSLDGAPCPEGTLVADGDAWRDLQLAKRAPTLPLDTARERRAQIRQYFERVRRASVVVMTLGLVEVWHDRETDMLLNAAPTPWMTRRFPDRFSVVVTDYAQTVAALEEIYAILNAVSGGAVKIVVTVSPVPMAETFTGRDVVVANAYSKSTLRAAAEDSARAHANVDYYPSYETITVSNRTLAFNAEDEIHVLDSAVRAVANHFLAAYGLAGEARYPEFVELDYLYANPDVHRAVLAQQFESGYQHWLAHGRAEGRALRAEHRAPVVDRLLGG